MIRKYGYGAAICATVLVAALLRVPHLGNRPFHGDEAVHAFKFRDLWLNHVYHYDPNEYHGPVIYYAALPTVAGSGARSFAQTHAGSYRLAIAVLGIAMVPLVLLLGDAIGKPAAAAAALLLAISPVFVFYSRYYIQEVPLALFTLGAIACWWRYRQSGRVGWLCAASISAGLMLASKETAAAALVVTAPAWWLARRWCGDELSNPNSSSSTASPAPPTIRLKLLAGGLALATAYMLLSGMLSAPKGPLNYFGAFTPWLRRASETHLHNHPWSYYLSILAWNHRPGGPLISEALVLGLAGCGALVILCRFGLGAQADMGFLRFLLFYTLLLTLVYCAIPYKTPWCLLSFYTGFILLAGVGAVGLISLFRSVGIRWAVTIALALAAGQLGRQAYAASFLFETDAGNPFAYAQPSPDVAELGKRVAALAAVSPQHDAMIVKVIAADMYYWPIPWYVRQMQNVGYWTSMPQDPAAPVVIADSGYDDALTAKLNPTHLMIGYYGLRPGTVMEVWVRMDLWTEYIKQRKRPPEE